MRFFHREDYFSGGRKEKRGGRKEERGGKKEEMDGRKEKTTPCPLPPLCITFFY